MNKEWDRLVEFLNGVAAASQLFSRAAKNGFFIEAVCLASNLIDALLRTGIILRHQIETKSQEILIDIIMQKKNSKKYSEREIFKISKKKNIIDDALFKELSILYEERNKVIHRYIITDIKTTKVLEIGIKYEVILEKIRKRIYEIEKEQIQLGVGMAVNGPEFEGKESKKLLNEMIEKKHGADYLSKAIKKIS
jgi:uncharacterized protein YutE (UPF0331/DUF86 family)